MEEYPTGIDFILFQLAPYESWQEIRAKYGDIRLAREAKHMLQDLGVTQTETIADFKSFEDPFLVVFLLLLAGLDKSEDVYDYFAEVIPELANDYSPGEFRDLLLQLPALAQIYGFTLKYDYTRFYSWLHDWKMVAHILKTEGLDESGYEDIIVNGAEDFLQDILVDLINDGPSEGIIATLEAIADMYDPWSENQDRYERKVKDLLATIRHPYEHEEIKELPDVLVKEVFHYNPLAVWYRINPKELQKLARSDLYDMYRDHPDALAILASDDAKGIIEWLDNSAGAIFLYLLAYPEKKHIANAIMDSDMLLERVHMNPGTYHDFYHAIAHLPDLHLSEKHLRGFIDAGEWKIAEEILLKNAGPTKEKVFTNPISHLLRDMAWNISVAYLRYGDSPDFRAFLLTYIMLCKQYFVGLSEPIETIIERMNVTKGSIMRG